jgi:hypothetical protein
VAAGPGLPFHVPGAGGNLSSVVWHAGPDSLSSAYPHIRLDATPDDGRPGEISGRPDPRIGGLAGPTATVMADEGTPAALIEAAFASFLANVTSATPSQVQAWSSHGARQSEWASMYAYPNDREVRVMNFRVSVTGPFRLGDLYNETGGRLQEREPHPGVEWHKGDGWSFQFAFAQRTADLPNGIRASADSRDVVHARVPGYPTTTNASLAQIQDGFRAVGIDIAGPRPEQFSQAVC